MNPVYRKAHALEGIAVDALSSFNERAAASWQMDGARFHVWFNIETGKMEDGVLYKNPPSGIKSGDQGYFHARKLDATNKVNAAIIANVFQYIGVHGLVAVAIAAKDAEERAEQEKRDAYLRAEKVKEAAPELLAALQLIATSDNFKDGTSVKELQWIASDAIKRAQPNQETA